MKIIGLTGGMGSGKSTIAREFNKLGVPIYIADDESKKILDSNKEARQQVKKLLGAESYVTLEDGSLKADRKYIASQVFDNKALLQKLNQILHPLVRSHFELWLTEQKFPYLIYEAAILLESGGDDLCDHVLLVTVDKQERIKRIMKRDGINSEAVEQRLRNQWTDKQRLEKTDFIIINDNLVKTPALISNMHQFMLNH